MVKAHSRVLMDKSMYIGTRFLRMLMCESEGYGVGGGNISRVMMGGVM